MNLKNYLLKRKLSGDRNVINELWREIFENRLYDFESLKPNPHILDVGANIGIATLYFKHKYPQAKIKSFEPVPESFEALKNNIAGLDGIEIFNIGLSDENKDGVIFGESDTTCAAVAAQLKNKGKFSATELEPITVRLKKLSQFIDREFDFMKIDIEGSEGGVFKDLDESGKLKMINEIVMEYHYNLANPTNDFGELIDRLHKNGYRLLISAEAKKESYPIFIRAKKIKNADIINPKP